MKKCITCEKSIEDNDVIHKHANSFKTFGQRNGVGRQSWFVKEKFVTSVGFVEEATVIVFCAEEGDTHKFASGIPII